MKSVRPSALFVGALVLCALAALASALDAPLTARVAVGVPFLVFGAPLVGALAAWTPVEPSPVKLASMSALLTLPALALAGFAVARFDLPLSSAALLGAAGAVLSLAAFRKKLHFQRQGKAQLCALALAFAALAGGALLMLSDVGLTLRAARAETVTHAGLALSVLHGPPVAPGALFEQPWLAGGGVDLRGTPALAVATAAALLGVGPLLAAGALAVLGWGIIVALAYLGAAALWPGAAQGRGAGVRDLAATVLGPAAAALALGEGLVDPGAVLAIALASGALFAALHASRSGARPWPGLAALHTASAAFFAPSVGLAAAALAGALLLAGGRRVAALCAVAAAAPGVLAARASGHVTLAVQGGYAQDGRALLAFGALAAAPVLLAALHRALPRGLLVAGALVASGAAAALAGVRAQGSLEAYRAVTPGIVEEGGALRVRATTARLRSIRRALEAVRKDAASRRIGLADGAGDGAPPSAVVRWAAQPEDAAVRPPALTPLLTGLPLFWAPAPPPGSAPGATTAVGDDRSQRGAVVRALLGERSAWSPRYLRALRAVTERGLHLYVVVTEADRVRTSGHGADRRGPDLILQRLGAEVIHSGEDGEEVWWVH